MKICYKIKGDYRVGAKHWYILQYVVVDPSHSSGPPTGEIKTTFSKGDLIDIAFPVGNPDAPKYDRVTALVANEPHGNFMPDRGWMITVYYDDGGIDFGEGYRVIYEAKFDDIEMDSFEIGFSYKGRRRPGKQPWGFTATSDPNQHTELGETSPCRSLPPKPPFGLRKKN
jgi:hypothetical protein